MESGSSSLYATRLTCFVIRNGPNHKGSSFLDLACVMLVFLLESNTMSPA